MTADKDNNDDTWIDIDMIKSCVAIIKHSVFEDDEIFPHVIEVEKMVNRGEVTMEVIETNPHFDAILKWMKERTF